MPNPDVSPAEQTDVLSSNEQSQKIADRLAEAQARIANGTGSDLDKDMVAAFNTGAEAGIDMSDDKPTEETFDPSTISDIVNIDDHGRGHVSDSISGPNDEDGRANNGQFLSNREMEVIAANADLIRNNIQPIPVPTPEPGPPEERTPIPRPPEDVPTPEPGPPEERTPIPRPPEELTPEPGPRPEPSPEDLSLEVARVSGATKGLVEAGTHEIEEQKRQNSELGFFRRFAKNFKFMTLFKDETIRKRCVEVFQRMSRPEPPPYTTQEYSTSVRGLNEAQADAEARNIIDMVNNPDLRREGVDLVIEGEGGEDEHPAVASVRAGISEALLPYLQETSNPNMSPEDYQARTQAYQENVRTLIDNVMQENPDFNREALSVMTDTSLELANRARVFMGHEGGMDRVSDQLRTMKISLGEIQIGPNAEYNTEYLDRTLDRMSSRAVDSMLARASFSVGTFLLSGAMAHGLSEFSMQTASRSGAKYGGALVGGLLFGPVGVGVGLAASSLASGMFARRLARRQAQNTIVHVGVEQGDSSSVEKTKLFEQLAMDTLDFSDIDRVYMASTSERSLPDGTVERVLRPDMSLEDKINLIQMMGNARTRLAIEQNSNPPVNLLSSQTPGSYLTERVSALQNLGSLESLFRQDTNSTTFDVPTGTLNENGQPLTREVNFEDLFNQASSIAATEIQASMERTRVIRDQYIRTEGRRAALIGGTVSALGGVGVFGVSELISHGISPSAIESLGLKSGNGEATQRTVEAGLNRGRETLSSNSGNVTAHFNSLNGSKVEVLPGGKSVAIETPTGRHMDIPLNGDGGISPKDILDLKRHGINFDQTTQTTMETQTVPTDVAFSQLGGKPMEVTTWLNNGTPESNGTELGTHLGIGGQGQIIIEQNSGTAFNGGQSFDLNQMASQGKLNAYLVNDGQTVTIPMSVGPDGNMYAAVPTDSPLHSMFGQSDGRLAYLGSEWHIGIATDNPTQFDSVSSLLGPGSVNTVTEQVPVTSTNLNFDFLNPPVAVAPTVNETEYIFGGLVPTPDGGVLYGDRRDNRQEGAPTLVQVPVPPRDGPTPPPRDGPTPPPRDGPTPPPRDGPTPPPRDGPTPPPRNSGLVGNTIVPTVGSPIPGVLPNSASSSFVGNNTFIVGDTSNRTPVPPVTYRDAPLPDDEGNEIFNNLKNRQFFDDILDSNQQESGNNQDNNTSNPTNQGANNQDNNTSNQNIDDNNPNAQRTPEDNSRILAADDLVGATRAEINRLQAEITTERGWGEDISDLEKKLQGQRDMLAFLMDRDYLDESGNVVSVGNNQPENNEQTSQYEGVPLTGSDGLIDRWAQAENNSDTTTSSDIIDYLKERMKNKNLSDNLAERLVERLRTDMEKRKQDL